VGYAPSEEQEAFRAQLRRFLAERSPAAEVRRCMETDAGWDEGVWKQMAEGLGLQGLAIPESCGGQGHGFVELSIALSEMGRALLCAPYLSSVVLAGRALARAAGAAEREELLGAIAAGERATLAWVEPGAGFELASVAMQARPEGAGYRLSGAKTFVLDGHTASRILVVARLPGSAGEEGLGLFLVDGSARGLARRRLDTLDRTRKQARLELERVRARPLGVPGHAGPALSRALDDACVALANEMVGGMERVLEMAVAHARTRVQFGRAIGSFQAVKHKCADLWIELEGARSAARAAARAVAEDDPELPTLASVAKSWCSEAYVHAANDNIQIHGGVGFTWEHDAHLYLRRARSSQILLGDGAHHRERVAQRLGS
jgi:alkylation response protein AidB-like acyl-CoA dehydrogenase